MSYAVAGVLYLWIFWYVYILVMGVYRAHLSGRMTPLVKMLAFPAVVVGYLMDVVANLTIASLVFLELPRELLVTSRLKRYIERSPGTWRGELAERVCNSLLDVFDPTGDHC